MNGKYGDLLKKARGENSEPQNQNESKFLKKAKQQTAKPEIQLAVNTDNVEETEMLGEKEVSLTIKVPISWRQHWVAECKRSGKTLKEVVTEMLTEKYGLP